MLRALLLLVTVPGAISAQMPAKPRGNELERVETYLRKVGAAGLESWLLERELKKLDAGPEANAVAARLGDALGRRLLDADGTERDALVAKLDALLKSHPAALTTSLSVLRLEGDFLRGEARVLRWVDNPEDEDARVEARVLMLRVFEEMGPIRNRLLAAVARGNDALDRLGGSRDRTALERSVRQDSELAGRAAYHAGWAGYYANLMGPMTPTRDAGAQDARLSFRKLLALGDEETMPELEDINLENPSQARVVLGLALAELACGHTAEGRGGFSLLRRGKTHSGVRDWLDFWEVWALLHEGLLGPAREVAWAALSKQSLGPTPARAALCKTLLRRSTDHEDPQPALGELGVRGLARMNQFDLARGLLSAYPVDGRKVGGMLGDWVQGQALLEKAEESREADDYEAALSAFQGALKQPEAPKEASLSAVCHYAIGCVLFRLDRVEEALPDLREAAANLAKLDLADAPDAEWMAALAATHMAKGPEDKAAARAELVAFRERHPQHPSVRLVNGLLERLAEKGTPEPTPANVPTLESCRTLFNRWKRADPATRTALMAELKPQLNQLLEAETPDEETRLMAAELCLSANPPDLDSAGLFLKAGPIEADSEFALMRTSLELRRARLAKDEDLARTIAHKLVEKGRGGAHETEGRIALAKMADEALARTPEDPLTRDSAIAAYRSLVNLLGTSAERLRANVDSVAALSRLIELARAAGHSEEANRRAEDLLAAFPNDAKTLRTAAHTRFEAGRFDQSLAAWRTLAAGSKPETDAWYEATAGSIECLTRINMDRARQAYSRARVLHPGPWPERWRESLQRLGLE